MEMNVSKSGCDCSIKFVWSIGSNALGKGMSCCIAGDGHPLKGKPPEPVEERKSVMEGRIVDNVD